ncbi:MAG: RagB/SusD family nutrient uptake outer membrane protein, partial [Bacteroidia bacterium]|nr:RagB/SusD family nutrient uptake outer membrane protein [Bacteroidia bacterium]
MKKLNYIFLLSIISLASCSKYLDTEPVSNGIAVETNSSSVAFKNASELEAALAGAYGDFKNEYYQLDYFVNGDAQSDDAYAGGDNPANFQIDNLKLDATNSNVSRDWRYLYATIGKCNKVINNADSVTDASLTSTRKNEIKGEASFIRAFMYFQLVQLWGDVPLILLDVQTISAEKLPVIYPLLFPARNSKEEVYKRINEDLKFALANVKSTNIHKGYATTGAVNVMLAKVAAAQPSPDWTSVKKYCDDVIAGGYTLLPDYNSLWDNANENSAESIFEINYSGGNSDGNWGVTIFRGLDWK